jgi:hypothetical protein
MARMTTKARRNMNHLKNQMKTQRERLRRILIGDVNIAGLCTAAGHNPLRRRY